MLTFFVVSFLSVLSPALASGPGAACDSYRTPRGETVTTCGGRITARRDDAGNARAYAPDGTIVATDSDGTTYVLRAGGR